MSQSKLELPGDVANKIFGMLKPKARPACVLCFRGNTITFKQGSLSKEEIADIVLRNGSYTRDEDSPLQQIIVRCGFLFQVQAALFLDFRFQDEASRARWQKGESFEMYRDAVHGIA